MKLDKNRVFRILSMLGGLAIGFSIPRLLATNFGFLLILEEIFGYSMLLATISVTMDYLEERKINALKNGRKSLKLGKGLNATFFYIPGKDKITNEENQDMRQAPSKYMKVLSKAYPKLLLDNVKNGGVALELSTKSDHVCLVLPVPILETTVKTLMHGRRFRESPTWKHRRPNVKATVKTVMREKLEQIFNRSTLLVYSHNWYLPYDTAARKILKALEKGIEPEVYLLLTDEPFLKPPEQQNF